MAFNQNSERPEVHIPVRFQRQETLPQRAGEAARATGHVGAPETRQEPPAERDDGVAQAPRQVGPMRDPGQDVEQWRDRALRLQAEMANLRKRQERLTEQRVAEERERLVAQFAAVADDLERALAAGTSSLDTLRQGVGLTQQALLRMLAREGVLPIHPRGEMFDPRWHEAVSTVPHTAVGVRPNTVVDVTRDGYRIGDRLVRPAHVVVAV